VFVDQGGFRFAYVPHLIDGSLSLIDLDGEFGPELSAVEREFYRTATFEDLDVAGGFAVAQRGCDPADPPRASRDCSRPLLYSTHRFFPGMRSFTAAPGLEVVVPGGNIDLAALGSEVVESRPFMGDLEFESDASLLVVQTTPGGLARVDTSLDEDGNPRNTLLETVALCDNPNILELFAPENGEPLALVTCFGDGLLAVIGLGSFSVLQTIQLGAGANEIAVDSARAQAYVANTREDTISIVSLDPGDPAYLTEWARLGVGVGAR
jgi:hypothetical protein